MKTTVLLFLLLLPALMPAQEARGTITGRAYDPSGAPVPGVQVRLTNHATRAAVSQSTNQDGNYTVPYLLPGVYDLSASFNGFKTLQRPSIEVRVNDVLTVDLHLQLGAATESVEVSSGPPLLDTATVSMGQVVDRRSIAELPLQAGNAEELTLLAPGVVNTTNLRQRKTSFNSASSQFSTDGNALYANAYTIDGIPDTFAYGSTPLIAFQPPTSAVAEFKVETSAFDASLGHTPGAVVNLVTKGGTNDYHGELHEWFINSALDSGTFFQNRSGGAKPVYQDNRYGASIGGPILIPKLYNGRNRTFFFYAWESNLWGKPTANIGTVPTAVERTGDFSALLALGPSYRIYDPLTTTAAANGRFARTPFPNNIIPAGRLDPVARNIEAYYAAPNTPGTASGENNYTRNTKDTFDYYVHFVRLDHQFSEKNRMFVRLDYDHYLESNSNFYGNIANGLDLTRINRGGAVDDVIVLSPSSVLDLRYGLTQESAPEQRRSAGFPLASLGFSPSLLSLVNPATDTFPNVYMNTKAPTKPCTGSCTGTFSGFGNFQSGDGTTTGITHDWSATASTLHGNHYFHYGADIRLYRSFGFNGGYDVSPGLQFLPTYTNGPLDNSPVAPIGQEYASFLLGVPAGQMTRSASYATQNTFYGLFAQDDWKLSSKLTLNVGLRYEYESPVSERYDRSVRGFDRTGANPIGAQAIANYAQSPIPQIPANQFQAPGGLLFAGPNSHALWSGQNGNLLPRIGLAYQLNDKTVIRSGYGIFYDTIGVERSPAIQTGFTASTPIQATLDNGLHFIANTANPFPNGLLAPQGAAGGLATYLGQSLSVYPVHRLQPYSQRWAFSVQRIIAKEFLLDVGYVGNKAVHLPVDRNIMRLQIST
ncbi:MAG: TonB-dependent receptor [Bryobacteraceae bacterium]